MGSLDPENDPKQELDDSGYAQEDGAAKENSPAESKSSADLLDLSDDVLLYILQYCSPIDLKALGFTCARLGTLILDRTLWQTVDARTTPTGRNRMRWYLTHALSVHTTSLKVSGYARESQGCLGYMSGSRDEPPTTTSSACPTPEEMHPWNLWNRETMENDVPERRLLRLCAQALPRYGGGFPYWPEQIRGTSAPPRDQPKEQTGHTCPGPQVTLTHAALCRLTTLCSNLTELSLEHVVIDCNMTKIGMFPQSLRKLSLLGTKCFNLEKSFLYKIQDHLVYLEDLDVSECEWVEPACMLPLSKLPRLVRLSMRLCAKLTEFVAYASLATRYGFKQLRILDMRGSPVGDSEVSALGWVPLLEQLYLSPASPASRNAAHAHFSRDPPLQHSELHTWELEEPEYYKSKYDSEPWIDQEKSRPNTNQQTEECAIGSCVLLHHVGVMGPDGDIQRPTSSGSAERGIERPTTELHRMGYVIPKNGIRRTINMYPDNENDGGRGKRTNDQDSSKGNQEQDSRKRKQEGESSATKHFKDGSKFHNEATSNLLLNNEPSSSSFRSYKSTSSSEPTSLVNEPPSSINEPTSSINEPTSSTNDPTSSINDSYYSTNDLSSNDPSSDEMMNEIYSIDKMNRDVPTKGSRKHFDSAGRISRKALRDSLEEFKKRTQIACDFKDSNSYDSDDNSSEDDDNRPQRKRSRPNAGASTSKSDVKDNAGSSKNSTELKPKSKWSKVASCDEPNKCKEPDSTNKEPNNSNLNKESNSPTSNKEQSPESSRSLTLGQGTSNSMISNEPNNSTAKKPESNEPSTNQQTKDNQQKVQRFVRFRLNQPPVFIDGCGNQAVVRDGGSNQPPVVIGGSNPPVVIEGNQRWNQALEGGGDQPPIAVGSSNNQPPIVVGCSHNQPPILVGCSHNQPPTMAGCSHNQTPPVVGCIHNQPPIVVGCSHNHPPLVAQGFSIQPVVIEGGSNQPVVIEGCSHRDDNHNVHNNNDVQQPDWNRQLNLEELDLDGQRLQLQRMFGITPSQSNEQAAGNAIVIETNAENQDPNDLTRHRILYVNVGRRRHAMYQISMPEPVDLRTQRPLTAAMNLIYASHIAPRLEYTSLITDAAIRRFGRADGENINYIQIGHRGPVPAPYDDPHARPNRSNLRILSVTGFRHITNSSLMHLATAAPHLQSIDFTGTRVTESGVEHFRNLRPDCRVRYGPIDTPRDDSGRPHSR